MKSTRCITIYQFTIHTSLTDLSFSSTHRQVIIQKSWTTIHGTRRKDNRPSNGKTIKLLSVRKTCEILFIFHSLGNFLQLFYSFAKSMILILKKSSPLSNVYRDRPRFTYWKMQKHANCKFDYLWIISYNTKHLLDQLLVPNISWANQIIITIAKLLINFYIALNFQLG